MVEVPDYVAQRLARVLRGEDVTAWTREEQDAMANLIDPKSRTLRDEVIAAVESVPVSHVDRNRVANAGDFADAVLPAVKASLDALPMTPVRLGEDHLIAGQFTQTTKRTDIDALFGGTS